MNMTLYWWCSEALASEALIQISTEADKVRRYVSNVGA